MRKELEAFAQEMEKRLAEKDGQHPKGWSEDGVFDLLFKLDQKINDVYGNATDELDVKELNAEQVKNIYSLMLDIANYAMMIADKTK